MSGLLTPAGFPYGAPELKKSLQKHLAEGWYHAVLLHLIARSDYWAARHFLPKEMRAFWPGCRIVSLYRTGIEIIQRPPSLVTPLNPSPAPVMKASAPAAKTDLRKAKA